MEVIGSKGVLWVTRCTGEMLDMPPLVLHLGNESVSYQMPMDWIESFNGAAADFVEGIPGGSTADDGRRVLRRRSQDDNRDVQVLGQWGVGGACRIELISLTLVCYWFRSRQRRTFSVGCSGLAIREGARVVSISLYFVI